MGAYLVFFLIQSFPFAYNILFLHLGKVFTCLYIQYSCVHTDNKRHYFYSLLYQ